MSTLSIRRAAGAALATAIAFAAPCAAHAAEVHIEPGADGGRAIVFTGAPGEANSVLVDRDPGFTNDLYQVEDQDNPVTSGAGCSNKPRTPFSGTEESIVQCETAGVTTIRVELGDGRDSVSFGTLNGNVVTDVVNGGEGDDSVTAAHGPSVVSGGGGNDTVDSRGGDDQVTGGDGDDDVTGGPGNDVIAGEGGKDTLRGYYFPGTLEIGVLTKFRGGEVNQISGGDGADLIEGDNGPDQLSGGAGGDRIHGGGGADVLKGDAGNDRIEEGDTGGDPNGEEFGPPIAADVVQGGSGTDTATYCTRRGKTPLSISLDGKANDGRAGEKDNIGPSGDVENVVGGGVSNDRITGNRRANVLSGDCVNTVGDDGNNKIYGLGGNDRVVGGDGNDLLNGGSGADRFVANDGKDAIQARDGRRDKSINCEAGTDRATVDRSDPPAFNCERVRRQR